VFFKKHFPVNNTLWSWLKLTKSLGNSRRKYFNQIFYLSREKRKSS